MNNPSSIGESIGKGFSDQARSRSPPPPGFGPFSSKEVWIFLVLCFFFSGLRSKTIGDSVVLSTSSSIDLYGSGVPSRSPWSSRFGFVLSFFAGTDRKESL